MHIRKQFLIALYDLFAIAASLSLALYLRVGNDFIEFAEPIIIGTPIYAAICLVMFTYYKISLRVWQYTSTQDLTAIAKSVTIAILLFLPIMFVYNRLDGMPRSLMIINWFVAISLLCAPRFAWRMWREKTLNINVNNSSSLYKINVILIGVTEHSERFLRAIDSNKNSEYRVVAIIDQEKEKHGSYIRNIKVHGGLKRLRPLIELLQKGEGAPQKLIIAPDVFTGEQVQRMLNAANKFGLTLSRLPRVTDFSDANEQVPLRTIMLEDLLGRPQKTLDKLGMQNLIEGKRVLISGAGGSIGSELVRQVASFNPSHIALLEMSELNLYAIDMELSETYPNISRSALISDVRDGKALSLLFDKEMPHIVFHAAALKHVPMSEINASETVLTNIIGSKNIADACVEHNVEEMIMISSDKAVNPTNVMGATKRMAERYVQSLGNSKKCKNTKFVTIRFGNVLGSTGSVIPLFQRQILAGGPITVTHPDIKRYFMTIREAVELVIEAGALTAKNPVGDSKIYVLDMGEPVLITDLAKQLIRLSGREPDKDIMIEFSGLRPGEKLFEELFHGSEAPIPTTHEGILLANPRAEQIATVTKLIKKLETSATARDDVKTIALLHESVPEYS